MNIETTNVDPKIKACIAIMEAQLMELKPTKFNEFSIREYLRNNPTAKIPLEINKIKEGAQKAIKEYINENPQGNKKPSKPSTRGNKGGNSR